MKYSVSNNLNTTRQMLLMKRIAAASTLHSIILSALMSQNQDNQPNIEFEYILSEK